MNGVQKRVLRTRRSPNALVSQLVSHPSDPVYVDSSYVQLMIEKFQLRDVKWAPDGKGLLLVDKDVFCCAFEVEQDDED